MESTFFLARSLFFIGIGEETDLTYEIPYPVGIPESSIISEMYIMENFCGRLSGLILFNDPVDISSFKTFTKKSPDFMKRTSDMQQIQSSFQDNLSSIVILLSPLNRRWQAQTPFLVCPMTSARIEVSPSIIVHTGLDHCSAIVDGLDLMILSGYSDPNAQEPFEETGDLSQNNSDDDEDRENCQEMFVEYLKLIMAEIEKDRSREELIETYLVIPKLRACLEASGLKITERLMKYIVNLIRHFKNSTLVAQAFNDLILNPFLISKTTSKARELYQEFLIVYYPQLICMAQFKKYLAKRVLLIEVNQTY